jgi:uncharacterized membrane protein YedE/YeeE
MSAPLPLVTGWAGGATAALLLGAAFGVALERGGLGDARKLTGQFYGTDFTVFKVMFTAIVVAMLGLVILGAAGVVDRALVSVTPTWLLPQIVGGLVFGVGFVMGGYCPGTGCTAAASGRLDALALVAGLLLGTLVFGELFPLLRGFYDATPRGPVTLPEFLHLPIGAEAALITAVALGGFVVAERIERGHRTEPR